MTQAIVLSILRHLLTAAGAWAVTKGYIDDSGAQQAVGGFLATAAAIWGALEKKDRKEGE